MYYEAYQINNKELNERRAKRMCFWCDERFVLGYKWKNKKVILLKYC